MRGIGPLRKQGDRSAVRHQNGIDAETGQLTDSRDMPWCVTALFISQPLYFGGYGGLPLKIIRALLDMMTIVVFGTGVYLWPRRRKPGESVARKSETVAVNRPMLTS